MIKIFENDLFFVRDDVESGIEIEDNGIIERRYSVFSKVPYRRLMVYCGPKEWAIEQFWLNYDKLLEELEKDLE